ncbi:MAG TPA: DUF6496 domain-containing protein [Flavitalea sp.]|nr:DUF6496 domain-containing protein [Flavitalea sp.]
MPRYSKAAGKAVESAMRRKKKGALRSGSGAMVKSRKQAIAIGLSEARKKGAKVPPPPEEGTAGAGKRASKGSASKKAASKRSTSGRSSAKKSASGKSTARKTVSKRAPSKKPVAKKSAPKKSGARKRS